MCTSAYCCGSAQTGCDGQLIEDVRAENAHLQARVEELEQERDEAKGLPADGEICHSCGSAVAIVWTAKDEDWRKVVGGPGGILCPRCFADRAQEKLGLVFAYIAVPLADGWRTNWYGYKALAERCGEWTPILEIAQRQDIKWKKPMPEIDFEDQAIYVWALKAQEEMGELSAALLGGLIGKEGRGDTLEECYQLIAVLLRIARAATSEEAREKERRQ